MTPHWEQRVKERIGNVDPQTLWDGIIWAIENNRTDLVRFYCRVSKTGRRVFRFITPDRRYFFALVDTEKMVPLTVMPEGFKVSRQGKPAKVLRRPGF